MAQNKEISKKEGRKRERMERKVSKENKESQSSFN